MVVVGQYEEKIGLQPAIEARRLDVHIMNCRFLPSVEVQANERPERLLPVLETPPLCVFTEQHE